MFATYIGGQTLFYTAKVHYLSSQKFERFYFLGENSGCFCRRTSTRYNVMI